MASHQGCSRCNTAGRNRAEKYRRTLNQRRGTSEKQSLSRVCRDSGYSTRRPSCRKVWFLITVTGPGPCSSRARAWKCAIQATASLLQGLSGGLLAEQPPAAPGQPERLAGGVLSVCERLSGLFWRALTPHLVADEAASEPMTLVAAPGGEANLKPLRWVFLCACVPSCARCAGSARRWCGDAEGVAR